MFSEGKIITCNLSKYVSTVYITNGDNNSNYYNLFIAPLVYNK